MSPTLGLLRSRWLRVTIIGIISLLFGCTGNESLLTSAPPPAADSETPNSPPLAEPPPAASAETPSEIEEPPANNDPENEPEAPPAPTPNPEPAQPAEPTQPEQEAEYQPPGTIPPDEEFLRRVDDLSNPSEFFFETESTIDGSKYGLVGDGVTDNTDAFTAMLKGGNRTIDVPPGDYVTNKLEIEANTVLNLAPGVTIRDAGNLERVDRILNIRSHNVRIHGLGARVVSERSDYTTGEYRHGVFIYGASRVLVEGLESSDNGGDGFYIGGPAGQPSTDVMLKGCKAENNRRQGLTITAARRVRVIDCEFTATIGTAPEFGIDLEPNYPYDPMDDIVFIRPQTRANAGGDIMINLHAADATSEPMSVWIIDHIAPDPEPTFYIYVAPEARASLMYSRSDWEN